MLCTSLLTVRRYNYLTLNNEELQPCHFLRRDTPRPSFPKVRNERDRESRFAVRDFSSLGSGMTLGNQVNVVHITSYCEAHNHLTLNSEELQPCHFLRRDTPTLSFPTVRNERDRESFFYFDLQFRPHLPHLPQLNTHKLAVRVQHIVSKGFTVSEAKLFIQVTRWLKVIF